MRHVFNVQIRASREKSITLKAFFTQSYYFQSCYRLSDLIKVLAIVPSLITGHGSSVRICLSIVLKRVNVQNCQLDYNISS